jgi:hypothetical protein
VQDEFEPPDLVIVKADGSPFRITAAKIAKTDAGIPFRVDYTIADDALQPAGDIAKVWVISFEYSERGLVLREKSSGEPAKAFLPMQPVVRSVILRLPETPPSSKWKLAVMVAQGVFTRQDGTSEPWSVGNDDKVTAIARAALYAGRRP